MRKYPAIDLIDLYSNWNSKKWNKWLTFCLMNNDIESLKKVRYGLQAGASDAAEKNFFTEKLSITWLRMIKSIELTMKKILRQKYPNPIDNIANKGKIKGFDMISAAQAKRMRDLEFEKFLKESAF